MTFKPMLASPADLDTLRYPLLASPKLDGIRAVVLGGRVLSRKLLEIPNRHVQTLLGRLEGMDGELILGDPTAPDVYRKTNSAVMSHDGEPPITFYVFDWVKRPELPYEERMHKALHLLGDREYARWHLQERIDDREDLEFFEAQWVNQGYEGLMLRDPRAPYKFGRSTAKEQILLKVKRFEDSEAQILGVEEEMANLNEAGRDALGRTKRSHAKAGKVGKGTMGALLVRDLKTGVEFSLGGGFTAADRAGAWEPGEIVKYKFFPVGVKDKPRHPIFIGRRSKIDL